MEHGERIDYQAALKHLRIVDHILGAAIEKLGPCTLVPVWEDPFVAFAESILYQQLSGKAAATIISRVKALFGNTWPTPQQLLATPDEKLRSQGVSRNKILALKDLAAKITDNTLDFSALADQTDEQIIEHVTQVRGIGRWTS